MTPEAQRICIAEACGWRRGYTERSGFFVIDPNGLQRGWSKLEDVANNALPDYLNSLDAMHEAVMTLDRESLDYSQYCSYLNQIVAIENSRAKRRPIQSCDATAAQRAEAFLRTLNLWQD